VSTANPNQAQIEFWNLAAARWIAEEERLDRAFSPLERAALARAAARAGERVIDIGCGCGASTLQLAERVGLSGSALGLDISGAMLVRARGALLRARRRSRAVPCSR
jgi:trans-aconitate methyltransferase